MSERLLYARHNSRHAKLSIVVGYAPTENADEEAKDDVYDSLQSVTEGIPKHDVLLMLGDFNARVGSNNENRGSTLESMESDRSTTMGNDSDISAEETIGETLFEHKDIHKMTWKSPDGATESQIDHIITNI